MAIAADVFDDRRDKGAHAVAGIVTALFAVLLLLLLWLINITTPIPPIPADPEVLTISLYNGPPGGTNQVLGGGSQGNTGKPGSQNSDPTENNSNPSQTGAITSPTSPSDIHSNATPTPNSQPSVSSETQALLDKLKNKKNSTSVTVGGQGNSGPYSTGIGDDDGPGPGPGDGGLPGDGPPGGGGDKKIRITYSPDVANPTQEEGVVSVRVSVNREGNVTKAEATPGGSTTGNPQLKATATQSAYKVRFNADEDRPEIVQCVISFNFTLQK